MNDPLFRGGLIAALVYLAAFPLAAEYVNFESSHVHPLTLTPSGDRLLVVNTPDAILEVFVVEGEGRLAHERSIPVGLEPVSVRARSESEAWVVNNLSDSLSLVDLAAGAVVETLNVGDAPLDVAFAAGKAFVTISGEDAVEVYDASSPASPTRLPLFGRRPRALAVAPGGGTVYGVVQDSGNRTTALNANVIFDTPEIFDPARLDAFGRYDMHCDGAAPPYPPLPPGIARNPDLVDPPDGVPEVGLIVRWNETLERWEDEVGQDWSHCLPFRLPDHDLFAIDADTLAVREVDGLGTTLFEVSVHPTSGRVYVPHTEARNFVRFEHELGVRGHIVDNRLAVVDPGAGDAVTILDLNGHIDRSDPGGNEAERQASLSQPGMLAWSSDGSRGYLTSLGTGKVFALDGGCLEEGCLFGPDRSSPTAVEVGEGPTGVALHESYDRLYVLNRISHDLAVVEASSLQLLETLSLHDPSPEVVREGRRFLYDAAFSAHGDAACSTCHISGHNDGLAWDLGDPTGEMVPYSTPLDNVRFVRQGNIPCDPEVNQGCADHEGFDPQKGPMTTQTLRAMLEPMHWRGDRATFRDFNPAFVSLLGAPDRGPVAGRPAGLTAEEMELFRDFILDVRFPPNPNRTVADGMPDRDVPIPGTSAVGNPTLGRTLFLEGPAQEEPCAACHRMPFGAAGGRLGGVEPTEPTSEETAALLNGTSDRSMHNDLRIPHLRDVHEKRGPIFGPPGGPAPLRKSGFGITHDGTVADILQFLSVLIFNLTPDEVRHLAAFVHHFPTGTRPCVGTQLTLPPGPPPTGTPEEEALLATLLSIANPADPDPHGALIASAPLGGRVGRWRWNMGLWWPDDPNAPARSSRDLRQTVTGPLTYTCVPLVSGMRLGGDRDEDGRLNGVDCAEAASETWSGVAEVPRLEVLRDAQATRLRWPEQSGAGLGPELAYEVLGGRLSRLAADPLTATSCLASDLASGAWDDRRPGPGEGEGWYYLVRATNACGPGPTGDGRSILDEVGCP